MSVSASLFDGAKSAVTPNLVGKEGLLAGTALMFSSRFLLMAIGNALGGIAVTFLGYEVAFIINSLSFPVSAYSIWLIPQAAWFADGKSFVISASEDGRYFHLWKVSYPNGEAQALTVGLTSYNQPDISADGKKILALQSIVNANLYVADAENLNEQKPLTAGNSNRFGVMSLTWSDDQKIIYGSQTGNESVENLWLIDLEGRAFTQITNEKNFSPNTPSSDGKFLYYNINRNRFPNINRVSLNGETVNEFTNGSDGARRSPQVTADGNWLYYSFFDAKGGKIMRRNLNEQREEVFLQNENVQCGAFIALSPDEKYLGCFNSRPN